MEQKDRNTKQIAHKPTAFDIAVDRAMHPDWNRGIEPLYNPGGYERKFNPSKYSNGPLLTIGQIMKKGTQSDVALKIMNRMSQSEIAMRIAKNSIYGAYGSKPLLDMNNEELEELQRKDHESKAETHELNDIKGAYMGICNMSSCKSGKPASWYNYGSLSYYCPGCAKRLSNDPVNRRDAFNRFGHDLCLEGPEITKD